MTGVKKILFICTGNICRSPVAEAVLRKMAAQHNIAVEVDSAGLGDWHEGEPIDQRAAATAAARGYDTDAIRSRPITLADFDDFDIIYAMTREHCQHLESIVDARDLPPSRKSKIRLFLQAARQSADDGAAVGEAYDTYQNADVPDPYYGGQSGFDTMLNLIESGCESLLCKGW